MSLEYDLDRSQATPLTTCHAMVLICRASNGARLSSSSIILNDGPYISDTMHQCPSWIKRSEKAVMRLRQVSCVNN